MPEVQIDAGTLTANAEERTVTGLLVPYGEECSSNLGKFSVGPGAFTVPADVPGMFGFNVEHQRETPIGRGTVVRDTEAGIVATFSVARTPEGDAALADIAAGTRKHLSAEVSHVVIKAGKAVGGTLFGGALVARPAFPSATLLAAAADTDPETPVEEGEASTEAHEERTFTDEQGITYTESTDVTTVTDGTKTTTTTVTTVETTEPEDPAEEKEGQVPAATAPNTLTAAKPGMPKGLSFQGLIENLARAKATGDSSLYASIAQEAPKSESLFAALSDVKYDTAGSAGVAIDALPQWLGELWSGRAFQRRIIPLIGSAPLTSLKIAGWRWLVKPEVGPWAGNKAVVPSNVPTTEAYDTTARRLAGAHDIAREYRDFNVPGFWEGYYRGMTESYDRQADDGTLTDLLAAATPVVRGSVPTDVSAGMVSIVDGALAILDEGLPSYAVVAKDVYREILLTRNDDTLTYLNAALGLEDGTIQSFRVVPHKGMAAGTAFVGAKEAATSYELPGVPIRVEGLDMVKGGIDPGLFGYYGTVIHDAAALALVSPPAPTV